MSMIKTFNSAISSKINKSAEFYKALIGDADFVPDITIDQSSDFNCGALCNELEFARVVSNYYVRSLDVDEAEEGDLEETIQTFIDLPRSGTVEQDVTYRNKFRFLVTEKTNERRSTKWAIKDAISYFLPDAKDTVQIVEIFDSYNLYFEVRIEGVYNYEDALTIGSTVQGFVSQNYVGGMGIGEVVSYLRDLISRIKAAGVDFTVYFISQTKINKTSDCVIGAVQIYKSSKATVKGSLVITKVSSAYITT